MAQLNDLIVAGASRLLNGLGVLGSANMDSILPNITETYDLGASDKKWKTGYIKTISANDMTLTILTVTNYATIGGGQAATAANTGALRVTGGLSATQNSFFAKSIITTPGNSQGIKVNAAYITAADSANGEIVLQGGHLRFGGSSWDYNYWAGLKYDHSVKTVYLGIADNSIFKANAAQTGGTLALPAIRYLSINDKIAIDAVDTWLRINETKAFSAGVYFGTNIVRTDGQLQVGDAGSKFYANNNGNGYFSNTLGVSGTNTNYKLYVNGKTKVGDGSDSSSSSSGAFQVSGGVGVSGVSYFAKNIFIPASAALVQNQADTSNYTQAIKWYKGGASQNTHDPQIGCHNTGGDGTGSISILPYATATDPWGGSVGLFVSKGILKLDNKRIPVADVSGNAGTSGQPVYSTGGVLTGVTCVSAAYGGTGCTSHTANRLVWSVSATKLEASYHYANSTKVAINSTAAPNENFYVGGTSRFTNTINMNQENNVAINFRPGLEGYYTTISYLTSGNEAMVFATKNAVTSFIFINGEDSITNHASNRWTEITPALQIKNNGVYIGELLGEGVSPSYKLKVNGTTYFNGASTINGATTVNSTITASGMIRCNGAPIFGYRYSQSNNAPAFVWDKPGNHYTGMGANGSGDTIYFGPVVNDGTWTWASDYKQKWVFNGTVTADSFIGTATVASEARVLCTDSSMKLYAQYSNEVNFGGANTSSTIFFGYRAVDSKPIPSSFIFGGSTGTATITASKVYGAVWNDYAEFRQSKNRILPGHVVVETGRGDLVLSSHRLQPGGNVVSDTFGFAIGETKECKTPIAVSGRVLVYPYEERNTYEPGDAVCTGPCGTVSKMTREEIREYPERIIGTVSEIPEYDTWGQNNVEVNGRIWIKVL